MIRIGGAMFDPEQIACIRPGYWKSQVKGAGVYGVVVNMKNGTAIPVETGDEETALQVTGRACRDWEEAMEEQKRTGDGAVIRHFHQTINLIADRQADMGRKLDKIAKAQTAQGKKLTALGAKDGIQGK